MAEQTDKSSHKTSKAVPKKRPAKTRTPRGKSAKAPGRSAAKTKKEAAKKETAAKSPSSAPVEAKTPESAPLAPDPATITFGSNRPIVAQPQKMPESSGLRFSGPSNGELKASGPQPNSAKASGLTFTTSKSPAAKQPNGNGSKPGATAKATTPEIKTPETTSTGTKAAGTHKPDTENSGSTSGAAAESKTSGKTVFTKPAIAPQASGRRLEKERSSRSFAGTTWVWSSSSPASPIGSIPARSRVLRWAHPRVTWRRCSRRRSSPRRKPQRRHLLPNRPPLLPVGGLVLRLIALGVVLFDVERHHPDVDGRAPGRRLFLRVSDAGAAE